MSFRATLHLVGHALLPGVVAKLLFAQNVWRAWLIMLLANLVDVDHLLADPVYDPNRCSVGYHPLHSVPAILVYGVSVVPKRTRALAVGLLLHMLWDQVDCWWMHGC